MPRKYQYNFPQSHFKAKGNTANLLVELDRFATHGLLLDDRQKKSYDTLVSYLTKKMGRTDVQVSTLEAIKTKRMDSSPGEPWVQKYPTFRHLVNGVMKDYDCSEDEALERMASFVDFVEKEIVEGREDQFSLQTSYYVHSKEDKYAPKKILEQTYRSIQGSDWVPQVLAAKYSLVWSHKFKDVVDEVIVRVGPEWDKRMSRFFNKPTFASDMTAFDRCVNSTMIEGFVNYIGVVTGMPVLLKQYMIDLISCGSLILPDGRRILKSGGNPSGMHWTTELNCFVHLWMCIDVYSMALGIEPTELLDRVLLGVCGDDEIAAGDREDLMRLAGAVALFETRWGFTVKVEKFVGEDGVETPVFPPRFNAPFLDCTSVQVGDVLLPLPVRPHRRLATLFYDTKGCPYTEVLSGVFESMSTWSVWKWRGYQVPPCVEVFSQLLAKANVGRSVIEVLAGYGVDVGYGCVADAE